MRSIENARYIIRVGDGATAICDNHRFDFIHIMVAAGQDPEVYAIDPDDEPIVCQACHLAAIKDHQGTLQ